MPFTLFSKSPYLSRKLLISILLVSSLVTLLLTCIQLYFTFRHEVSQIEKQLQQVEKGFLDSIAESVWDMDMRRLEIQLQGLKKLPAMYQFRVLSPNRKVIASIGSLPDSKYITKSFELSVHRNTREERLGRLEIVASLEGAFDHLQEQVILILISQGLKTFLVSGFILFIVNYLVMRHLTTMARYAKGLDMKSLHKPLELDVSPYASKDELFQVAQAINTMRENFLEDIARREQVESELEHLHDYLQNIFNSIPSSMIAIAPDCTVARWNTEAENVTGLPAKEAEGQQLSEVLPFLENEIGLIKKTMKSRITNKDIHLTRQKDGKEYHSEVTVFPLIRNGLSGAVVRIDDITEKYELAIEKAQLEEKLLQAQKMEAIGTLAGGIAHDFNNILTAILGYGEMVLLELNPEAKIHANQQQVLKAGERAKELVKHILVFSRQADQERCPVQVQFILQESLKLLRPAIPATITIDKNIDKDCGAILADVTQVHQIIMNLCTNAYHAMRESGGVLDISLNSVNISGQDATDLELTPGSYVKLEITDTGYGINRQTLARIFDPYFTTKKKGEGTGLGLAVVHGIVKSYNGHISVDSEQGKGTSFQVYLPELEEESAHSLDIHKEPIEDGNERIMVIDDQPEIVDMLEGFLVIYGYQVSGFSSSVEALDAYNKTPDSYDLIITDMTMPDMTGTELAINILQERPEFPIILCTGFSDLINSEKAKELGIREFVMKPVGIYEINKIVRKVLDS